MTLFSQKYANTIRTVSGTVSVEPTDVVLNVTTSSVAATLNLQEFTSNYWSTQYKLYVFDASGNAGTNNITIVAPSGYTINGGPSAIINVNNGSAIIRIVSNLTYQAQLSSFSNTSLPLPYFTAKKLLQSAVTYVAIAGASTYSVTSGTSITGYTTSANNNLLGFDPTTGVWTVPTSGYYSIGAKMITRINADVNTLTNSGGSYWMSSPAFDGGSGFVSIGIIVRAGGGASTQVVTAEKQLVTMKISDINIECTQNLYYFTVGDLVSVQVLNKTDLAIDGIAASPGSPDCLIDFSATKIS